MEDSKIFGNLGILISVTIIGTTIYTILKKAEAQNITTYDELLEKNTTKKTKKKIKTIVNIFLLITFYIMVAGFGSFFKQELETKFIIGEIIIATASYIIFTNNIEGIIKVNEILIPILITIIIAIFLINFNTKTNNITSQITQTKTETIKGITYSILYSGYNTILLIPIIIQLKKYLKTKKSYKYTSITVIMATAILAYIIIFLLTKITKDISKLEIPILCIEGMQNNLYKKIYKIAILSAIFTSAISVGYSFLKNTSKSSKTYKKAAAIICISSLPISKIGFSNLINSLYPIFGILGIMQIFMIIKPKLLKKNEKTDIK